MKSKFKLLLSLVLLLSLNSIAQTKYQIISDRETQSVLKNISGFVKFQETPLSKVNVTIKNSSKGTTTNLKGHYSIKAKKGDILKFSYVGMQNVEVIVEDITSVLNIDMRSDNNKLKEVVINAQKQKIKSGNSYDTKGIKMPTSYGKINVNAGGSRYYFKGDDLNYSEPSIMEAIKYRMPPFRSTNTANTNTNVLWDVDGGLFTTEPIIDFFNIQDILVLRSLSDLIKYGSAGRNGVIVIRTKTAYFDVSNPYSEHNPYTNKVYYNNDAQGISLISGIKPDYLMKLQAAKNAIEALNIYNDKLPIHKQDVSFYIDVANFFKLKYNNLKNYYDILNDANANISNNPEALKAIAYNYESQGMPQKALNIYKEIMRLRPKYAQSFRDLANAYVNNNDSDRGWKIYMNYIYRGHNLKQEGIGQIIFNEMESLFTQNKNAHNINETFIPNDPKDIKKDIRIVFEWNASEAEFILEFVNPLKKSYSVEHSYYAHKKQIIDEKTRGYSSTEFFINKIKKGDWLVNLTYLGNKKYTPTYLKATIFYNWGRPNQTKEIKVFKLVKKGIKVQLFKFNNKQKYFSNN